MKRAKRIMRPPITIPTIAPAGIFLVPLTDESGDEVGEIRGDTTGVSVVDDKGATVCTDTVSEDELVGRATGEVVTILVGWVTLEVVVEEVIADWVTLVVVEAGTVNEVVNVNGAVKENASSRWRSAGLAARKRKNRGCIRKGMWRTHTEGGYNSTKPPELQRSNN